MELKLGPPCARVGRYGGRLFILADQECFYALIWSLLSDRNLRFNENLQCAPPT